MLENVFSISYTPVLQQCP